MPLPSSPCLKSHRRKVGCRLQQYTTAIHRDCSPTPALSTWGERERPSRRGTAGRPAAWKQIGLPARSHFFSPVLPTFSDYSFLPTWRNFAASDGRHRTLLKASSTVTAKTLTNVISQR